jgi:hypothetical protein
MNASANVHIDNFCSVCVVSSSGNPAEVAFARSGGSEVIKRKIMVRTRPFDGTARRVERRSIDRRRLYRSALLSIPGQIVAQDCRVRDFTVKGAGIRLNGITLLPLTFELSLDAFHATERCRLIWRDGYFAGAPEVNSSQTICPLRQATLTILKIAPCTIRPKQREMEAHHEWKGCFGKRAPVPRHRFAVSADCSVPS